MVIVAVSKATLSFYRVYMHPLSKFPGPDEAAVSRDWQRSVVMEGHPELTYEQLHEKYNKKAIRIAPNELHISDVNLYKTIYRQGSPYLKDPAFYAGFGEPTSLFPDVDQQRHKQLRKIMNPMFSKGTINKYEILIKEQLQLLTDKLRRLSAEGPVEMHKAFKCFTGDVIGGIAFGRPIGLINESPNTFDASLLRRMEAIMEVPIRMRYSQIMKILSLITPEKIACMLDENVGVYFELRDASFAIECLHQSKNRASPSPYPILFDELNSLPEHIQRTEAGDLLVAALDTVAFTLSTALFHMSANPKIQERLRALLKEQIPDKSQILPLRELEQIDYLYACVKEAIRVGSGIPGSLPRVVPKNAPPLVVDDQIVPPGTIVNMSAHIMNFSKELWGDDAHVFNPDRWTDGKGKSLEQNLHSFSKGTRQCIGINLAYAEIFIALAYLIRNFRITTKTTEWQGVDRFTYQAPSSGLVMNVEPIED
ncbi:cytochrome P450 [Neofusicoccum parvum]|uniref:Cytochrome P450, partial n=1 Tax=Neofusicoccum parvum TaxID=310453 RepID=A0ACB5SI58_9PEZI|nr:cytochrome P450 [Neofusicoccum parvum]